MTGPKSVVFLNRFYWPDVAATAQMLTDLAEDLAGRGWEVTVVTSRSGYNHDFVLDADEERNRVRVHRVRSTRLGRGKIWARMLDYLSYFVGAFVYLLRMPRPDVVVAMTDPPLLVSIALVTARMRGARTVHWVQDLFPQLAGRLGVVDQAGPLYRTLDALSREFHRRCDAVVAVGPRMVGALVEAGAAPQRTVVAHNWSDSTLIRSVPRAENPFAQQNGLQDKFVIMYSGNAGRAHHFDTLIEAMYRLREVPDVLFVFVGGGKRSGELRSAVEHYKLPNARFLDYVPRDQLAYSLSAADVSVVTEDPRVTGLLVPSKTYGILASARPLLFVGPLDSDVAQIVREVGCGLAFETNDADGLTRAILRLRDAPDECAELGARARQAAETRFDRRDATAHWVVEVEAVLAREELAGSDVAPVRQKVEVLSRTM